MDDRDTLQPLYQHFLNKIAQSLSVYYLIENVLNLMRCMYIARDFSDCEPLHLTQSRFQGNTALIHTTPSLQIASTKEQRGKNLIISSS